MSRKHIALLLIALSLVLTGLIIAAGLRPKTGGPTGWTIIRTPDGLRLHVPIDWPVDVDPAGTRFANADEALDSLDSALAPGTFHALIVAGTLNELPLPERIGSLEVAAALADNEDRRGVSFRGPTGGLQALLIVKEITPARYAGIFASAAPGLTFPHQRELEEIVANLSVQPMEAGSSPGRVDFWVEHQQTVRRMAQEPRIGYDVLAPEDKAGAPQSGWPVLVLALEAVPAYASIAQDGLGIVVKPQLTYNSFEEDRQILDAVVTDIGTDYPADVQRLILLGCSMGGQFAFEYTLAEPNRVLGAVVMAAPDLVIPPAAAWQVPFVFFYGDLDPLYDAENRAVIESMQQKMKSVELYLDAGQAHFCDSALGIEAVRALLEE